MKKIVLIVFALIFGLSMNAQDKKENVKFKPTIKFNGRVQYDFEFIKPTMDNLTDAEQGDLNFNGNEFRRAYLSAKGKIGKKLGYKLEFEFAGSKIGYRDVYISYDAGKAGKFAVGSMAEATGLNMTTSSKYITFVERSMLTSFQDFRWGAGFHYANYKIADNFALQMSLTNNGGHHSAFQDKKMEEGMNFVARATYAVINNKENNSLVHLGVNYDSRQGKASDKTHFRIENHMGHKYELGFDSDKRSDLGFEVATNFGPLSIQGEYKMNSNDVDKDVYGQDSYKVNTYYAFVSYFVTGEHRPYKHGTFGRVKPKHDVDNGGFGALELAARYSAVDNSDIYKDYATATAEGGIKGNVYKTSNITLGLNWYLNSHARIMYNTVLTDFNGDNGEKQLTHLLRFAVDF